MVVVEEVMIRRRIERYDVGKIRCLVVTRRCAVELSPLSGQEVESLIAGVLMGLFILVEASAVRFFLPSKYSTVISS